MNLGNLGVVVMSVGNHVLVPIEVQVKFKLLQQGQVIRNDVCEIGVPFSPHGVVEGGCLPDNIRVLFPLSHRLVNPIILSVALQSDSWVAAHNVS